MPSTSSRRYFVFAIFSPGLPWEVCMVLETLAILMTHCCRNQGILQYFACEIRDSPHFGCNIDCGLEGGYTKTDTDNYNAALEAAAKGPAGIAALEMIRL